MSSFSFLHVLVLVLVVAATVINSSDRHCQDVKDRGVTTNGYYMIDPDGVDNGVNPFEADCDLTTGQTHIHHDRENLQWAGPGNESPGSFQREVIYEIASHDQIVALIENSEKCKQFITMKCTGTQMWKNGTIQSCWANRDGTMMMNWCAADGHQGCGCSEGTENTCKGGGKCNCDITGDTANSEEDKGMLNEEADLPVTKLFFGDIGSFEESTRFRLGKLQCWGVAAGTV